MMNKNFLVTGGSGFIGSEAVRSLVDLGHNVLNLDKLTYASSEESLCDIPKKRYKFLKGDIQKVNDIKKAIELSKPDYILNFAAETHVDRSIDGPNNFINTNIIGTYNLLSESLNYFSSLSADKKKIFKLIHISTDEVYGSLDLDDEPFNEFHRIIPNSPYSASKASSDMLVRSWFKTYKLPVNITRSSNNYGPWQYPEKLIPLTISNALKGNSIEVYGDGTNIRDWIYVKDNINAILKVTFDGMVGETYNIGGNSEISNLSIVKKICKTLDDLEPSNKKYSELITFVADRPGHDLRYAISNKKIKKSLSWSPDTDLKKGLNITVRWMLNNKEWLFKKSKNHKRIGAKIK